MALDTEETMVVNIKDMPIDLWTRFKMEAVKEHMSIKDALKEAVDDWVKKA